MEIIKSFYSQDPLKSTHDIFKSNDSNNNEDDDDERQNQSFYILF